MVFDNHNDDAQTYTMAPSNIKITSKLTLEQ